MGGATCKMGAYKPGYRVNVVGREIDHWILRSGFL